MVLNHIPNTAYFACLLNQTHLIQVTCLLVESHRLEMSVSDENKNLDNVSGPQEPYKIKTKAVHDPFNFFNDPNANGKIPMDFCQWNHDANFQVGLQHFLTYFCNIAFSKWLSESHMLQQMHSYFWMYLWNCFFLLLMLLWQTYQMVLSQTSAVTSEAERGHMCSNCCFQCTLCYIMETVLCLCSLFNSLLHPFAI